MAARSILLGCLTLATACSSAYADRPPYGPALPEPHIALDIAPPRLRAPYDVQIIRGNGEALPTYAHNGRFYVQGNANERYVIRVTNPTSRRIEAVVSVDGLDVIDGENGDLRKRGYVVPPYGETRIEGFRTSTADVATFRFSSVAGSYAGQKGKARNVGVIAVALFEEQPVPRDPEIIVGETERPPPRPYRPYGGYRPEYRDDPRPATGGHRRGAAEDAAPSKSEASADKRSAAPAAAPSAAGAAAERYAPRDDGDYEAPQNAPQRDRLGLGTEFGEQRDSQVGYTRFVRAQGRPVAIAELRYNDAAGLLALGIHAQPLPDGHELWTRETADPFPGDHFARAPR
jgi:hypothetical protein